MHLLRRRALRLLSLGALAPLARPLAAGETPRIDADQFRQDIAFVRDRIARMHPDLGFSADPAAVRQALDRLGRDLPATLDRDEAWRRLATLNPLFADAHFLIGYPDWRGEAHAWLEAGGGLFPVEVAIDAGMNLLLAGERATRILSVNGIDAGVLVAALLARAHGDTPAFRAHMAAQRWWLFYWKIFGAPARYRLVLEQDGRRRTLKMHGSRALPRLLREEAQFGERFGFRIRPDGVAVLTVGSFGEPEPAPFLTFTRAAFERIRQEKVQTLVIDISRNGGGDDAMWLEGLMPYLATSRYRTGSTHRGFTRPGSPDQLAEGEISTWREPQPGHPLHFAGRVLVRIGPATYSSAVLFANVMHDFGFATLVGAGGAARRSQSGGVRGATLPHSGLTLSLPRFILDPPAGRVPGALLEAQACGPRPEVCNLAEPI